jgi:putative peptide zinc metalloprotease protein
MTVLRGPQSGPTHDVPRRAEGLELIGEMRGSGYRVPPSLVRRGDGQTIQLTRLLYLTLEAIDGNRDLDQVAAVVSDTFGRTVSTANVEALVTDKLRPLGLLVRADGSQPEVKRSNPLLALRLRVAVTDPERTRRLTQPFTVLFSPLVAVPLLAAFALVCWWVFFRKGLAGATYDAFAHPGLLLFVFAVTILSAGFHEFGHAAAARRGGATPGVMGAGVYLVWPAFYTDVTDAYRLSRGGRLRTDLGGLYFNAIVAVAITVAWWATGSEALLLVVATQILQMLGQLAPLVRFDGYHVLADLTGVPDLFHRIKPTLLGVLPWRWGDAEARLLKPWARAVVTLWVVVVVPVLAWTLVLMVLTMPRVLATAWAKVTQEQHAFSAAWSDGDATQAAARVLMIVAVTFPVLASILMVSRVVRRVSVSVWKRTSGSAPKRAVALVTAALLVAGLAWAWWPNDSTYRPIRPDESGTLTQAIGAGLPRSRPAAAGQSLEQGTKGQVQAVWDTKDPLPTQKHPQLALVLVPTDGSGDGWVFPFNKPPAPGPGDNQALAVNTSDGTAQYDVAISLVWVPAGQDALNTNEAYAFASCSDCASVAVAFQVVLVLGDNHVAAPENIAGAVNSDCVNCITYALAKQLFVTLDGPLSDGAMAALDDVWAQLAAFADHIESVPLSEIDDQLDQFEAQILAIIEADQPGTLPSASPSATHAGSTDGPSPSPDQQTTAAETASSSPSDTPAPATTEPTASPTAPTSDPSPTP